VSAGAWLAYSTNGETWHRAELPAPVPFLALAKAGLEGDYSAVYEFSGPGWSTTNNTTVSVAQRAAEGRTAWPGGLPGEWSYWFTDNYGLAVEWVVRGSIVEDCFRFHASKWHCSRGNYPGDAGSIGYTIATVPFVPGTAYTFLRALIVGTSLQGALITRTEQSRFGSLTCLVVSDPTETYSLSATVA